MQVDHRETAPEPTAIRAAAVPRGERNGKPGAIGFWALLSQDRWSGDRAYWFAERELSDETAGSRLGNLIDDVLEARNGFAR